VVVQGNPLDDIDLLLNRDNVRLVVQGGKIVKDTMG
jgi:imidazolonepropionase-like amidohydrolase